MDEHLIWRGRGSNVPGFFMPWQLNLSNKLVEPLGLINPGEWTQGFTKLGS